MLRITFPQHWFNMSDQQAEDSLYDSASKKGWGPIKIKENLTRVFLTAKKLMRWILDQGFPKFLSRRVIRAAKPFH